MSKKPNRVDILANAYCSLIEAKLPIVGLHQRQFLDEIKHVVENFLLNHETAGLEDLYVNFGDPADTANRLAAVIADPESAEDPILPQYAHSDETHCRCNCHDEDDEDQVPWQVEIIKKYEYANQLADEGATVSEISMLTGLPVSILYMGGFGDPKKDMRDYILPVRCKMTGFVKVRAVSVHDAISTLMENEDSPIPTNLRRIPDTYEICTDPETIMQCTETYRAGGLGYEPVSGGTSVMEHRDEILESMDSDGLTLLLESMGFERVDPKHMSVEDFPCINEHDCENCIIMQFLNDCPHLNNCDCDCEDNVLEHDSEATTMHEETEQVCFFTDMDDLPSECHPVDFTDEV